MEFQCDVCGKSFVTDWDLKAHGSMHGRGPPPQAPTCSICGGQFGTAERLRDHTRQDHGA